MSLFGRLSCSAVVVAVAVAVVTLFSSRSPVSAFPVSPLTCSIRPGLDSPLAFPPHHRYAMCAADAYNEGEDNPQSGFDPESDESNVAAEVLEQGVAGLSVSATENQDNSGAADHEWLETIKEGAKSKVGEKYKDAKWSEFIEDVAIFLKNEDDHDDDDIIDCVAGLINYGIRRVDNLKRVSNNKDTFGKRLDGVLPSISDILFDEYVAPKTQEAAENEVVSIQDFDLQATASPFLDEIDPPDYICKDGWIEGVVDTISENMSEIDGGRRVSPLMIARCSRGGKTRGIFEIARGLQNQQPNTVVLSLSFNGGSTDIRKEEASDPLHALTRRIAFAAYAGERTGDNFDELFRSKIVSTESIKKWLGDRECVLFIDEINKLDGMKSNSDNITQLFLDFVKSTFLISPNRYFVFSTHDLFTSTQISDYLDSNSFRTVIPISLPVIKTVDDAARVLKLPSLGVYEVLRDGLIPGLIFTNGLKKGFVPKIRKIIDNFISNAKSLDDELISLLFSTFIDGERSPVWEDLEQLMDVAVDEKGSPKMRWIPAYMSETISVILRSRTRKNVHLSKGMIELLRRLEVLFEYFGPAVPTDKTWEATFTIVLLIRAVSRWPCPLFQSPGAHTTSVDAPLSTGVTGYTDIDNIGSLLAMIPDTYQGPHLSIYFPPHPRFEVYDIIVVKWDEAGARQEIIGYQLKQGATTRRGEAADDVSSILVRGFATDIETAFEGWTIATDDQVNDFFGVSGAFWTPKYWMRLLKKDDVHIDDMSIRDLRVLMGELNIPCPISIDEIRQRLKESISVSRVLRKANVDYTTLPYFELKEELRILGETRPGGTRDEMVTKINTLIENAILVGEKRGFETDTDIVRTREGLIQKRMSVPLDDMNGDQLKGELLKLGIRASRSERELQNLLRASIEGANRLRNEGIEIKTLTKSQLVEGLRKLGMKKTGNVAELKKRLKDGIDVAISIGQRRLPDAEDD